MARPRRFDSVEVSLLIVLLTIGAYLAGTSRRVLAPTHDTAALAARYGPSKHSEHEEEWIVRDFFQDRRGGFFVDVGANHYEHYSNTYYLETALGWSGLAIEPQTSFADGYAAHRPRTRFLPFFVSDESNGRAKLYVLDRNSLVSSADRAFNERYGKDAHTLDVPMITLDDLLASEHVATIDFLTMDIELWEPKALAGFDIDRYRPGFVCVEAHPEVRQQILDYFARHHYVVVGQYLQADTRNLYFQPLEGR